MNKKPVYVVFANEIGVESMSYSFSFFRAEKMSNQGYSLRVTVSNI